MENTGGKGSVRRPTQVTKDKFNKSWERIFGEKKKSLTKLEEIALDMKVKYNIDVQSTLDEEFKN